MNWINNFFHRKEKDALKDVFHPTTRTLFGRNTANGVRIADGESSRHSAIDSLSEYISFSSSSETSTSSNPPISTQARIDDAVKNTKAKTPEQIAEEARVAKIMPIEVFKELNDEDPKISFEDVERKITVVEERLKILREHLSDEELLDEHRALFFLKNRRTYLALQRGEDKERTEFDWALTNNEAVDDLCKRYKFERVSLKQYYTLVPEGGVKEIERFTALYKEVTGGDTPIIEIIKKIPQDKEQRTAARKKDRDPILVANSPFSRALFVLGAWDEEVEVVDEIIYGLK